MNKQTENASQEVDLAELTKEPSLFRIWINSGRVQDRWVNHVLRLGGFAVLLVFALLPGQQELDLVQQARSIVAVGFPVALGLLGFLLMILILFSRVAPARMLMALAKTREKKSGLIWMQVMLYSFMRPIIILLIASIGFAGVILLGSPNGLLSRLAQSDPTASYLVARLGFWIVACLGWSSLIALKTAIRNVYHVILGVIRWELMEEERKCL